MPPGLFQVKLPQLRLERGVLIDRQFSPWVLGNFRINNFLFRVIDCFRDIGGFIFFFGSLNGAYLGSLDGAYPLAACGR